MTWIKDEKAFLCVIRSQSRRRWGDEKILPELFKLKTQKYHLDNAYTYNKNEGPKFGLVDLYLFLEEGRGWHDGYGRYCCFQGRMGGNALSGASHDALRPEAMGQEETYDFDIVSMTTFEININ